MSKHITSRHWIIALSFVTLGSIAICGTVIAQGRFPNLDSAEGHLNAALDDLNRAPERFGGHKAEAIRLVRSAINEIEAGKASFH